jgi:carbamoyltransferase
MGLAPYGEPRYVNRILDHLIDLKPDGSFRLNQAYFNHCVGLEMTNRRFDALFGGPPRREDAPLPSARWILRLRCRPLRRRWYCG